MDDPQKLRELAAWYREFAEKTGNPAIWESRLRMAEDDGRIHLPSDFLRAAEKAWGEAWGHASYMVTRPVTLKAMLRAVLPRKTCCLRPPTINSTSGRFAETWRACPGNGSC